MDEVGRTLAVIRFARAWAMLALGASTVTASLATTPSSSERASTAPFATSEGQTPPPATQPPATPPAAKPAAAPVSAAQDTKSGPPARQSIGSVRSFEASSTVVYEGHAELTHRLQATYAFPQRSRWWLGIGDQSAPVRQMLFESGESVCALEPNAAASRELAGDERTRALMQLGLRRALFLWPLGSEWKRTGDRATAPLGSIGTMEAHFATAEAPNPDRLAFRALDGTLVDEFRGIAWRTNDPKKVWPTHLELWHDAKKVWTEDVVSVDTRTRVVDSFFVPPDRREGVSGRALEVGSVRAMDLPEQRTRRFPLAPDATWDSARAEQTRLATRVSAELKDAGLELENRATFEVSERLQPTAVVLRLAPNAKALTPELDKAWPLTPERPAVATFVMGLAAVEAGRMIPLREAIPADAQGGTPYVRFDPARPDDHVLIVLPLGPKDG